MFDRAFAGKLVDRDEKPTVPEVRPLVEAYYEVHPTGGNLHIVLDDGNVDDEHVHFCIQQATAAGDFDGATLGWVLNRMSKTQRLKLAG